ncbi:hypothetical protein ACFFHM_18645 [Halalkalibacter kiskunsagensis]|uniref:Uncharacterized protein n=1 Tax=Halalkalibacter kiskunsagensis TaxID=1548599 RepID=A0ABV6KHB4_9BACI
MNIERGTEYQISQVIKGHFNSADILTVIRHSGNIVQFTLPEGKGHGSMPYQHMQYLLKRNDLTEISNKRSLLKQDREEKHIG